MGDAARLQPLSRIVAAMQCLSLAGETQLEIERQVLILLFTQ